MIEKEKPAAPINKAADEKAKSFFQGEKRILRDIARGKPFS